MTKVTVAVLAALIASAVHAQALSREDLVSQIEAAVGKPAAVTATSPIVTSALTMARTANPDADAHTWDEVRADTAVILTNISTGPGSAFDLRVRGALKSFSDAELRSLNSKMNDPLLLKFRDAMSVQSNSGKDSALNRLLEMTSEINGVLAKYKLKPISLGPEQAK